MIVAPNMQLPPQGPEVALLLHVNNGIAEFLSIDSQDVFMISIDTDSSLERLSIGNMYRVQRNENVEKLEVSVTDTF